MRSPLALLSAALLLASCGADSDLPPMVTGAGIDESRADALFHEAGQAENAGKIGKATKLYGKLADDIPLSKHAAESRFREAKLLEQDGETIEAFDAYEKLIVRHAGTGRSSRSRGRHTPN